MFLWRVGQKLREIWIPIEHADTLDDIPMVELIFLTRDCDFFPDKLGKPIWKLFVNNAVEFLCT